MFCYEPRLGAGVGACRMCLCEIEGMPKLQTACTTPAADGMVVDSHGARAREGQDAVLEFLLLNHPLDCPVCDKGGECPLQDLTFRYGPPRHPHDAAQAHAGKAGADLAADQARPRALHPLLPLHALLGDRLGRHAARDREPRRALDHHHVRGPPVRRTSSRATSPSSARSARSPRPPTGSGRGPGRSRTCPPPAASARSAATPTPASARATSRGCSRATTPRSTRAGCATAAATGSAISPRPTASPRA